MVDDATIAQERARERRLVKMLVTICVALMGLGGAMQVAFGQDAKTGLALGDVSEAHMVEIRDLSGTVVLSGEFRSTVDAVGNTEKDAALTDGKGRTVVGEIGIELPAAARSHRRPELEVDIMGLPPRQTFHVVIDDRIVAAFTTDNRGSIDMELQEGELPRKPQGI